MDGKRVIVRGIVVVGALLMTACNEVELEREDFSLRYCDSDDCRELLEVIELHGPVVGAHDNGSFAAARLADGTVVGWDMEDALEPEPLEVGGPALGLAMGLDFLCARLEDGQVDCRGLPDVAAPAWLASFEPVEDAVGIIAGDHHACARQDEGAVVCWGSHAGELLGAGVDGETWMFGDLPDIPIFIPPKK